MEEDLRIQAVTMISQGVSVTEVARRLGKSRQWGYKWMERSSTGEPGWSSSQSRQPLLIANRTPKDIESAVIRARRMRHQPRLHREIQRPMVCALPQPGTLRHGQPPLDLHRQTRIQPRRHHQDRKTARLVR